MDISLKRATPYLIGGFGLFVAYLIFLSHKKAQRLRAAKNLEAYAKRKHGEGFTAKVQKIEEDLGMERGTLLSIMYSESGINPRAYEPQGGGGGLIGFMPSTLSGNTRYGVTTSQMLNMTAEQQLDLVFIFYDTWVKAGKRPRTPEEWYMLTFYPVAVGKPNSFVIGAPNSRVYQLNKALDYNKDGTLTKGDFLTYIKKKPRLAGTIFQPNKPLA